MTNSRPVHHVVAAASGRVPLDFRSWTSLYNAGTVDVWVNVRGQPAAIGAAPDNIVIPAGGGPLIIPPSSGDLEVNAIAAQPGELLIYSTDIPLPAVPIGVVDGDVWDPVNNCRQGSTVGDIGYDAARDDRRVMDLGSDAMMRAHYSAVLDGGGQFAGANTVTIVTPAAGMRVRVWAIYIALEAAAYAAANGVMWATFATSNFDFAHIPTATPIAGENAGFSADRPRTSELGAINEVLQLEVIPAGITGAGRVTCDVHYTEE